MEEGTISNNINLNVNQNDLIDVMVEDLKEKLELRIQDIDDKLKVMKDAEEKLIERYKEELLRQAKVPTLDDILKALVKNGIKAKLNVHFTGAREQVYLYDKYDFAGMRQHYKDPLRNLHSAKRIHNVEVMPADTMQVSIKLDDKQGVTELHGFGINSQWVPVKGTARLKALDKEQRETSIAAAKLDEQKVAIELDLLRLEFGEKRIKAKLLKSALGNTVEGKKVLAMLETVKTGVKLLS